jgi:outer membrane protein assembly factor BamE (lipoprotein component of BamABCDE complex)
MKICRSAAMLAALLVGACSSVGNDVLRTQDARAVDQSIIDGKTTRSQVEAMYGNPTATSFANAQNEVWVYRWARQTPRAENFIPYVGFLVASNDVQKKELVILFNEQNVVVRHLMRETSETIRRNLLSSSSSSPASSSGLTAPPATAAAAASPSAAGPVAGTGGGSGARPGAAASATGTPGSAIEGGSWSCNVNDTAGASKSRYLLEFLISRDGTITVISYGNARASIVRKDPLTFTAVNPRGARLTTFTLNSNNSIVVTGPTLNDPNASFYNEGTCNGMPLATVPMPGTTESASSPIVPGTGMSRSRL